MKTTKSYAAYAVAVVAILTAAAACLALQPLLAGRAPFVTLFLAIAFATWFGGRGPGLLALALGALAAYVLPPPVTPAPVDSISTALALYGLIGLSLILLIGNSRRSDGDTRLLAAVVGSSDDAIIAKTLDGVIQSWNAAAQRIFGYSEEEVVGRHISILFPHDRLDEEDQIVARLRAGERVEHFDTMRLHKDGHLLPVSLTISPVRDAAGRIIGASKVARDITERKRLEDDLQQLAADLMQANHRKDEFLAMLAHELRNPLAPILNSVRVLLSPENDAATARKMHEMIQRQAQQLARLVDDLLDVSRITQGKIELRKSRVDLQQIIHDAVASAKPTCDAKRHMVTVSLPQQPLIVDADPARIAQIVGNLINNACKFTDHGGQVSLSASREGDEAVIRVGDTGIGIAQEHFPRLFNLFTQLDVSLERSQGGLGIGLSLAKNLVEMHGGSIEARSEGIGKGSEFIVRLPACGDAAPAQRSAADAAADIHFRAARRVLVVDDNRDSASSLAMLLELVGHEVQTAFDGEQALEGAEAWRPDVILLDLGLPRLNGFEVARKIREQPWGKDVRLIALSGWGQNEDRRRTREAGFDRHLVKPANFASLMEIFTDTPKPELT